MTPISHAPTANLLAGVYPLRNLLFLPFLPVSLIIFGISSFSGMDSRCTAFCRRRCFRRWHAGQFWSEAAVRQKSGVPSRRGFCEQKNCFFKDSRQKFVLSSNLSDDLF